MLQFTIGVHELDVCVLQGPSLPPHDHRHPLLGQEVTISRGPCKGYHGRIKCVDLINVTIELEARLAGGSALQLFEWDSFMPR
jgi:hypothetical protein